MENRRGLLGRINSPLKNSGIGFQPGVFCGNPQAGSLCHDIFQQAANGVSCYFRGAKGDYILLLSRSFRRLLMNTLS
jgi:hypothetical protein